MREEVAMWGIPRGKIATCAERFSALTKANDTLGQFHALRRQDVESGSRPSLQESLARLG